MQRRITGIVAAVVLAIFGTIVLVAYVQSAHNNAAAGEQKVPVLVVTKTITRGTQASAIAGSVKTVQVPTNVKATGAVADLTSLKGLVAASDLVVGEEILSSRFVSPEVAAAGIAPPDKDRVTISLDPERVIGGQLHAGDTVAVVMSFQWDNTNNPWQTNKTTHMTLHQVLVTAVQSDSSNQTSKSANAVNAAPTGKFLVTLAVDAASVERVVFAAEWGKIWLSAEPSTAPQDGTKVVTGLNVY